MELSSRPILPTQALPEIIIDKHNSYYKKAETFKFLYFSLRVIAGLGAAGLPFIVGYSQFWTSALAATVTAATVLDMIFVPLEKWKLYSRISDRMWVNQVLDMGYYPKFKSQVDAIVEANRAEIDMMNRIQDMLHDLGNDKAPRPASKMSGSARPSGRETPAKVSPPPKR